MSRRIFFIDIFRGIAVLQMIFWQIFDFFSKSNIYSDAPYFIKELSMPINGIGIGLFAFISGVSLYFSIQKKKKSNIKKSEILRHIILRYGSYILVSLLLCAVVFGIDTFLGWNEAIQGIGLAAIVSGTLFIATKSIYPITIIASIILIFQGVIRDFIGNSAIINLQNVILNFTFRGTFSLSNLLPITLFGAIFGFIYLRYNRRFFINGAVFVGFILLIGSFLMHLTGFKIDYYGRSSSYLIFFIGLPILIMLLIYFISRENLLFKIISVFGENALFAYLFHFIVIYKPLELAGISNTFEAIPSFAFSIFSLIGIYFLVVLWRRLKDKFQINSFI